jgi:hypothetical protein
MKPIKTEHLYGIEYHNEKGEYHRLDGPAREYFNGNKFWHINGKLHREYGPAVEWNDGSKEWYLNNKLYTEQDWKHEVAKIKLKRILEL